MPPKRLLVLAGVLLAVLVAAWQRARALEQLPPDFDELVYLPVAYRYEALLASGQWGAVETFRENSEHPPLVKLLFAAVLGATGAPEPRWDTVRVGRPLPEPALPAFRWTRALSGVAGVIQVGLVACVQPLGALLLALDPYHVKYTSQAYLEALPGLFALLSVLVFERSRRDAPSQDPGSPRWLGGLAVSGALLGLAAAGKYPYALVAGGALLPFVFRDARARVRAWAAFLLPALATFLAADPALWPDPLGLLWDSVTFHWNYSHGEHVVRSALPWYQPLYSLTHPVPLRWHRGVFATGATTWVLLPLALLGAPRTLARRPVQAVWALVGLGFLLLWPTKWAQYLLLVLPPLYVCAGMGVQLLLEASRALWRRRGGVLARFSRVGSR